MMLGMSYHQCYQIRLSILAAFLHSSGLAVLLSGAGARPLAGRLCSLHGSWDAEHAWG